MEVVQHSTQGPAGLHVVHRLGQLGQKKQNNTKITQMPFVFIKIIIKIKLSSLWFGVSTFGNGEKCSYFKLHLCVAMVTMSGFLDDYLIMR